MKSRKFLFALLLVIAFPLSASSAVENDTITLSIIGPGDNGGTPHKSPDLPICAEQDGHVLSFGYDYVGCILSLLDEDGNLVVSLLIDSTGIVVLPDILYGLYELRLIKDNFMYGTYILL